jgi:hypothetical protein
MGMVFVCRAGFAAHSLFGVAGYSLAILLYLALMVFAAQAAADSL